MRVTGLSHRVCIFPSDDVILKEAVTAIRRDYTTLVKINMRKKVGFG
jgi:hypothetical protein